MIHASTVHNIIGCDSLPPCIFHAYSYPDQIAAALRDLLPCHLWPSRFESLTPPTSSSQPMVDDRTTNTESPTTSSSDTQAAATTTTAAVPTWLTPSGVSSVESYQAVVIICLIITPIHTL